MIAARITGAHWSGPRFFGLITMPAGFAPSVLLAAVTRKARIDGPGSMPTILISSSTLSWRVKIPIRAKGFVANDMRS